MTRPGTRVAHAGLPEAGQGEPFLPGPVFAAPFHLSGELEADGPPGYGRHANPTWSRYEAALGELEDAHAVVFSSGMAAVSAVLLPALGRGDVLVAPGDGYGGVRALAEQDLAQRGVAVRLVPSRTDAFRAALGGAAIVWLETPTNPWLDVVGIREIAAAAHAEGAIVVVDNTLVTPLGQRPLDLGADVVVTSASKHLTGHADLVLGVATTRHPDRVAELVAWRARTGSIPGPFEAWLAHRSLATLDVRLVREEANARALAELLAARDDVRDVRYPGLPGDPAHATAVAQMERFGTVVVFTLGDADRANRFLAACTLVAEATSFGGVHTSAERRARWGLEEVPDGFIRLSAGVEDTQDLLEDVERALDATR